MVIVKNNKYSSTAWCTGQITKVMLCEDGVVRVVGVLTSSGEITRPVSNSSRRQWSDSSHCFILLVFRIFFFLHFTIPFPLCQLMGLFDLVYYRIWSFNISFYWFITYIIIIMSIGSVSHLGRTLCMYGIIDLISCLFFVYLFFDYYVSLSSITLYKVLDVRRIDLTLTNVPTSTLCYTSPRIAALPQLWCQTPQRKDFPATVEYSRRFDEVR